MATGNILEHNLEKIVQCCGFSVQRLEEDVQTVKEWMKTQPHLPEIMDDRKIRNFLVLNRGSIEITKEKIDNYYTARSILPEIYEGANPKLPNMKRTMDAFYFVPLPKLTPDMYRVFVYKTRDRRLLENFDPVHGVQYLINAQEIRLLEDVMLGDIFVIDGNDVPLSSIVNITPTLVHKTLVMIYKKIYSNRVKAIYIVNAPSFVDKLLFILKAVLKPKIYERIHFCDNESLLEKLGKDVLPEDYGGNQKSLEEIQKTLRDKFQQYEKYFDKLDTLHVDESQRPEKLRNDDLLGFYGNFKKLQID